MSKAALKRRCQDILKKGVVEGDDHSFMLGVLNNHHDAEAKVGSGVAKFVVTSNNQFKTKCFLVERVDGSTVDFSFIVAIDGPPSKEKRFRKTLRYEINDQIVDYLTSNFVVGASTCAVSGETLEECHVDHYEPVFEELVIRFINAYEVNVDGVEISSEGFGDAMLVDRNLAHQWKEYHRANANLRLTSKNSNLSVLRKKTYAKPT